MDLIIEGSVASESELRNKNGDRAVETRKRNDFTF